MFQVLREVEDLLRERPGSKKEDDDLTKKLHNYIKDYPHLIAHIYSLCKESNCLTRIKEAVKSNDAPCSLASLLFKDLSDRETVEVLICCPKFLDAFLIESAKSLKEYWELWRFIYDPDTDDILQRSLRFIRLNLLGRIKAEHREALVKFFFSKILEKYVQKNELHVLEIFEIQSYYEYSKTNEELLSMWKEICIIQTHTQQTLIVCGNNFVAEEFYLGILNQIVSSEEMLPFLQMNELNFIAAVNYFVNCPGDLQITEYVKLIISEPSSMCKLNLKTSFITPELSVAKFILSDEFVYDPFRQYPEWSLKYCFLRAQMETLDTKNTIIMSQFINKYPKYFDHGLTFLSLVKGVHEMEADELKALMDLSTSDNYRAKEIFNLLDRYVNPLVIRVASEYSYIPSALRLVKNHFDELLTHSNQRAKVIDHLVKEEKGSQSTLESCLYYILTDMKNNQRKEVWLQYLRTLRHLVDIRLVSPVLLWNYLLKPHVIDKKDLLQGVFCILETLYLIPLVTLPNNEVQDFDESVKEPVGFIVDTINQKDEASVFAFKALCTLPDQMIKGLLPTITNELLCKLLVSEAIDALAKYTFMEIQAMPRTLLLGTNESNPLMKRENVDLSWFQPKKCAHSWFLDDTKAASIPPLLSIPFTLRQVIVRKIISHFTDVYATQKDPKLITMNSILTSCCSALAFSRVTGTAGKMFVDLQTRILEELNKHNVNEEETAICSMSLKLLKDEGQVLTDAVNGAIEQVRMKKFLDPTVIQHYSYDGVPEAQQTEFKGFDFYQNGATLLKEELKVQLMELMTQPIAIGLINALSLIIGYSSSNSLERDIVECVTNRIPEIAFKQVKFSIWIDAFYFCVKDSNKMKKERVVVSEPGYERIGKEYVMRLLLDRRDEMSLEVLTKCDYLPRVNWSCILSGSEEELIVKHLISRIVKDNPFVSPSLKDFALRLYGRERVSDHLINSLEILVEATDKKTVSTLWKSWDLNQVNVPLLVETNFEVGLDLTDVEMFILKYQRTELYHLLCKFDSNQPVTLFARLMSTSWTLSEFEKLIKMGISADHLVLYKDSPKVEFVDAILTCLKVMDKSFATALLEQYIPFKHANETVLWNALIMETPVPKRKRILALL